MLEARLRRQLQPSGAAGSPHPRGRGAGGAAGCGACFLMPRGRGLGTISLLCVRMPGELWVLGATRQPTTAPGPRGTDVLGRGSMSGRPGRPPSSAGTLLPAPAPPWGWSAWQALFSPSRCASQPRRLLQPWLPCRDRDPTDQVGAPAVSLTRPRGHTQALSEAPVLSRCCVQPALRKAGLLGPIPRTCWAAPVARAPSEGEETSETK